jgi:hypothetical protein
MQPMMYPHDDAEDRKATLDELMEFAAAEMGRDMRRRNGKPLADESPGEDPDIPGVEADGEEGEALDIKPMELDPERLKLILQRLSASAE